MSIYNHAKRAYKHQLKKDFESDPYLPKTVDGLLEYLFDEDRFTAYVVYVDKPENEFSKRTIIHRLNTLWLVPLWMVCIPFLWLTTGKTGVSQHGKLGKWISDRTGL